MFRFTITSEEKRKNQDLQTIEIKKEMNCEFENQNQPSE